MPMVRKKIKEIRENCKSVDYCKEVKLDFLESLAGDLFEHELGAEDEIEVLASICNVLLINKQLGRSFFDKYQKDSISYVNDLVERRSLANASPQDENFEVILPTYRMLFLSLYYGNGEISDLAGTIHHVVFTGYEEMKYLFFGLERGSPKVKLSIVEILKCVFSYYHKFNTSNKEAAQEEESKVFSDCLEILISYMSQNDRLPKESDEDRLLVRNILNLLFCLYLNQNVDMASVLTGSVVDNISNVILFLLGEVLPHDSYDSDDHDIHDLVTTLGLCCFISKSIKDQSSNSDNKLFNEFEKLSDAILPYNGERTTYNKLIGLLYSNDADCLDNLHISFLRLKEQSQLNRLIMECLYILCWSFDAGEQERMKKFLDLVGYRYAQSFLQASEISVPPTLAKTFLDPNPTYLDEKNRLKSHEASSKYQKWLEEAKKREDKNEWQSLSEEEKEIEAEKLFVLFERMEENRFFTNFKNPIKQWKDEGRFEEIDKEVFHDAEENTRK